MERFQEAWALIIIEFLMIELLKEE